MTICLSMIVKNEAHCIEKCLNSVKPFIDYWIICDDTRTTDDTEGVVKRCLKDIPGEYYQHQWIDCATNRNKSLDLARPKADYVLVIDADDQLVVNDPNDLKDLSKLAYTIEYIHGSITYSKVQLFKSTIPAKFIGVVHECIKLPLNVGSTPLENCKIIYGGNGANSKDPKKYLKAAEILEKELLSDPNNSRYVFYAAQCYRDANKLPEAFNLYMRRSKMGDWIEEQYVSFLEAGKISEIIQPDNFSVAETMYLSAYNRQSNRMESLAYLVYLCIKKNLFEKAYFYAKIGSQIAKPKDALFLETACYDWKIIDGLAIAAYYIDKPQESASLNHALLKSGTLPPNEQTRILSNLEFCETKIY